MAQYNHVNVKLSNSQLNKLISTTKNALKQLQKLIFHKIITDW